MTVRLFAAVRDAAGGRGEVQVEATTVAGLLAELGERHGALMTERLGSATVFVDEVAVPPDDTRVDLSTAREVVVVPPFAGGSGAVSASG